MYEQRNCGFVEKTVTVTEGGCLEKAHSFCTSGVTSYLPDEFGPNPSTHLCPFFVLKARYRRRKCQRLDFSFLGNKKTKVSPGRNGVVAARQIIPSELWMWDCTPRLAAAVKGVSCGGVFCVRMKTVTSAARQIKAVI